MTCERAQRPARQAGYTLVELLTAVAIFGVLAAAGLPHIDTRRQDIRTMTKQVIADYRWARNRAITSGSHFAVDWSSEHAYQVVRMKEDSDGDWVVDEVVKTVDLPGHIMRWGWPDTHEFNTRGMMVSTEWAIFQLLWDDQFSAWNMVSVWPSGQVYEEY